MYICIEIYRQMLHIVIQRTSGHFINAMHPTQNQKPVLEYIVHMVVSKRKQDGVRLFVFCKSLVFMVLSKHGQTAQTTLHLPLQLLNFTNKVVSHIQTPNSFNTIDYLTLLPTPFQQQLYSSSFLFRSHLYTSENDITFLCGIKYVLLKLFQLTS